MPATNTRPAPRVHHHTGRPVHHPADVLRDILLKPHPHARRGDGDKTAQQLHKAIQSGKSHAPETIATVLTHNGQWGPFGDACIAQDPTRTVVLPLPQAEREQARADYELRCALLAYEGGDHSAATINTIRESGKHLEHAAHSIALFAAHEQYAARRTA